MHVEAVHMLHYLLCKCEGAKQKRYSKSDDILLATEFYNHKSVNHPSGNFEPQFKFLPSRKTLWESPKLKVAESTTEKHSSPGVGIEAAESGTGSLNSMGIDASATTSC